MEAIASIFLTAVLVLVTCYYAYITSKILEANKDAVDVARKQVEALYRPYVTIMHRMTSDSLLYLDIENTGQSSAEALELKIDRNFYQMGKKEDEYNLANLAAFTNAIESFPPRASLSFALVPGKELRNDIVSESVTPLVFNLTATYRFKGKPFCEKTTVDLRVYSHTFTKPDPVEKQLKELVEVIKKRNG